MCFPILSARPRFLLYRCLCGKSVRLNTSSATSSLSSLGHDGGIRCFQLAAVTVTVATFSYAGPFVMKLDESSHKSWRSNEGKNTLRISWKTAENYMCVQWRWKPQEDKKTPWVSSCNIRKKNDFSTSTTLLKRIPTSEGSQNLSGDIYAWSFLSLSHRISWYNASKSAGRWWYCICRWTKREPLDSVTPQKPSPVSYPARKSI